MRAIMKRKGKTLLAVLLLTVMVMESFGGLSFESKAATSTTTENGKIGTAFPSSFSSTPSGNYYISNKTQLSYFQKASKTYTFEGVTIHLAANIDWGGSSGGNWGGIGKDGTIAFCGTFDGHGYSISNLYSTSTGLFLIIGTSTASATVTDFYIKNATIKGGEGKAIVVSRINGNRSNVNYNNKITNVTVKDSTASFSGNNCGVITGRGQTGNDAVTISGCAISNTNLNCTANTTTNIARWGFVLGRDYSKGYSRISNCSVTNSKITTTNCNVDNMGGIAGLVNGAIQITGCSVSGCTLTNGLSTNTITDGMGGIVGRLQSSVGVVSNCSVTNTTITAKGRAQYVGLLAGHLYGGTVSGNTVSGSTINLNYGASASQASRIGVIGCLSGAKAKISDCTMSSNTINNATRANCVGGFIGSVDSGAAGTVIWDCTVSDTKIYNTYSTTTAYNVCHAGVIGRALGKVHVTNVNVTNPTITSASLVQGFAGFVGYVSGTDTSVFTDCKVSGAKLTQTGINDSYKCYYISGFAGCVDSPSKFMGCIVTGKSSAQTQGRSMYIGGVIGSTYSDAMSSTPANGIVTLNRCESTNFTFSTVNSRNCNEFGGLVGWLSEGGTVLNCYSSGAKSATNKNAQHVGGLIGYISNSTSASVKTTVKNCYTQSATLYGKASLSGVIGNAVATSKVFTNNHYYNCSLNGASDSNAAKATKVTNTANLTNRVLVNSLNTTNGTEDNSKSWGQGSKNPVHSGSRESYNQVKVMSYNVYWLEQPDSYTISSRQTKIVNLLKSQANKGVGVFGLQEVTKCWYSPLKSFTSSTNYVWCGYGRYGGTFGGFGSGANASGDAFTLILYDKTKFTKKAEGHFWLSDTPSYKSKFTDAYNYRVVNWVKLRPAGTNEDFIFVNAHLEETRSGVDSAAIRRKQAKLIVDKMKSISGGTIPVIIVGDWNSYGGEDGYNTIINGGYQDLRKTAMTADTCGSYNAWTRTDTTKFSFGDHMVMSPLCTATTYDVLTSEDMTGSYHLSDHSPIVSTIRY